MPASKQAGDAVSYLLKAITTKQSSQSSQSDSRTKVRATLHKLAGRQSCRAQLIQSAIPTSDALSCFFKYFTSRQGFLSHDQGGPNCGRGLVRSRRRRKKRTTERWVTPSDADEADLGQRLAGSREGAPLVLRGSRAAAQRSRPRTKFLSRRPAAPLPPPLS